MADQLLEFLKIWAFAVFALPCLLLAVFIVYWMVFGPWFLVGWIVNRLMARYGNG